MNVKNTTKLTRLKCFKAFLVRYFDNGWLTNKFWRSENIKVDTEIKVGATDEDVNLLLSVLDYIKFLDLRNATAVLLMYRCGLRIGTIARMNEKQIDFVYQRLQLDGEVMKNHNGSILHVDEQMLYLLQIIVK
ncbi:tyrosine-type recombinase/integrase [Psychrobacillus sp. L4]|uniref:tyrosine-type recombinase/integrase n=1 Tax=Psychrobacillus sp. L4 TaxID=3236892 RepID=UPI0036F2BA01